MTFLKWSDGKTVSSTVLLMPVALAKSAKNAIFRIESLFLKYIETLDIFVIHGKMRELRLCEIHIIV